MARPCCCPPPEITIDDITVENLNVDFTNFNDYELEVLCDFNSGVPTPFVRVYRVQQDHTTSVVANRTLAGAAYVPTGTVAKCEGQGVTGTVDFGTQADFAGAPSLVSSYLVHYISGSVVVDGISLGGSILGTSASANAGGKIPKPTITGGGNYEWRVVI